MLLHFKNQIVAAAVVLSALVQVVVSSAGDRSYIFSKCLWRCSQNNCSKEELFLKRQPFHLRVLQWDCEEECKYDCMWHTVKAFNNDGSNVPQFFGKWPFMRIAGVQEPASMIFSALNALCHLSILRYRALVPSTVAMYRVWHGMALVGVITWTCAAVFHTRDFPITEKLDYFSAFGLVLYNLFTLIARLNTSRGKRALYIPAALLLSLYIYHIKCLYIHFDYGYNMAVNVLIGALNALGWAMWCWYQYQVKGKHYAIRGAIVVVGLSLLLMLELFDFPPLLWTFDAHALWHAGTVPLTLWWYRFITDDSLQMAEEDDKFKKIV